MKKSVHIVLFIISIFSLLGMINYTESGENDKYISNMKKDLLALMIAYPDSIKDIEKNNDLVYVIMKDGTKILYDDKKEKTFDESLFNPDIEDTLKEAYPLEMIEEVMEEGRDPGRIRHYGFLNIVYGNSEAEVQKNLVSESTLYGNVLFNVKSQTSQNLKKALDEAAELSRENPNVYNFVAPLSGTFNYRKVQGTGLLSAHAYGIAIDLKRDDSDYWKWCTKEKGSARISIYPKELVEIFEKYGFIWGGKWEHFDILHYEYRPEIILKAKMCKNKESNLEKEWYEGINKDKEIEKLIEKLDTVIGV